MSFFYRVPLNMFLSELVYSPLVEAGSPHFEIDELRFGVDKDRITRHRCPPALVILVFPVESYLGAET